VVQYGMVEIDE